MSERVELARQRLKEIRTVQGWKAAYQAAGLPQDGAKPNTQQKRLSRLINKRTGGYAPPDRDQTSRINRSYSRRKKSLARGRADLAVKAINRDRAEVRRNARRAFGPDGTNPNPRRLQAILRQNRNLSPDEVEAIQEDIIEGRDQWAGFRASYYSAVRDVDPEYMSPEIRRRYQKRLDKARWAHERDVNKGSVQSRLGDF